METTETNPTKAYSLVTENLHEGFFYKDTYCHAKNASKAKSLLLKELKHDYLETLSGEDLTYLNIRVRRNKRYDLIDFEGNFLTSDEIDYIQRKRNREDSFKRILEDSNVEFCYIWKHNSYYRPNYRGYTNHKEAAGIYPKADAVLHSQGVIDISLIPIHKEQK